MQGSRAVLLLGLSLEYGRLQQRLRGAARPALLEMPLSVWVRPDDRGVPFDLVRQNVGNLLQSDFNTLLAAPGVGLVKLRKLIELLGRIDALNDEGPSAAALPVRAGVSADIEGSEALWVAQTRAINEAGLDTLPLGRIAATLSELPRRLWNVPLRQFTSLTFAQLHSIPYVGESRIRSIQRITADSAELARASRVDAGGVVWLARRIRAADEWAKQQVIHTHVPTPGEVYQGLLQPLFDQVEIDLGARAAVVCRHVLRNSLAGIDGALDGAGEAARLSRPRISQLKEDVRAALRCRWPEGGTLFGSLIAHAARLAGPPGSIGVLRDATDLFYANRRAITSIQPTWNLSRDAVVTTG